MKNIGENIKVSFKRIYNAFFYSIAGLKSMYASEQAFRQDLLIFSAGILLLIFADVSKTEKTVMMVSLFLLLMAETVNTAIETVVDRISKEYHPLSKKAKDIGSFLVLLAIINLSMVWAIILFF